MQNRFILFILNFNDPGSFDIEQTLCAEEAAQQILIFFMCICQSLLYLTKPDFPGSKFRLPGNPNVVIDKPYRSIWL